MLQKILKPNNNKSKNKQRKNLHNCASLRPYKIYNCLFGKPKGILLWPTTKWLGSAIQWRSRGTEFEIYLKCASKWAWRVAEKSLSWDDCSWILLGWFCTISQSRALWTYGSEERARLESHWGVDQGGQGWQVHGLGKEQRRGLTTTTTKTWDTTCAVGEGGGNHMAENLRAGRGSVALQKEGRGMSEASQRRRRDWNMLHLTDQAGCVWTWESLWKYKSDWRMTRKWFQEVWITLSRAMTRNKTEGSRGDVGLRVGQVDFICTY